ncbi:MAG: FHA domain-containing protein [Blastocatellia bacterium]|nr:FHA domain-containing protein [Blastocatellia bacterium]
MPPTKVSLIVQPGDSFFPIVNAIDKAQSSVNITVFRMDDPIIQQAMVEAVRRGVRVRALIATSARGWGEAKRKLLKDARKAGIEIKEPAGDSKKTRFHYKIMMVDGRQSLVFTFNPTRENLHYTRDFGVILYDDETTSELNRLFDADWNDSAFVPQSKSNLLVSPYTSRAGMESLLRGAQKSIHLWDAKVEDPAILKILREKVKAGLDVRVLGDEKSPFGAGSGEPGFRAITRFKLHAKCVLVDGETASIGSMNLRTQSFDRRREVAIIVRDEHLVKALSGVFTSDWEQKAPTSASAKTLVRGGLTAADIASALSAGAEVKGMVLISRTDALRRHELGPGVTTVGRSDENDIAIAEALVSRHHARFSVTGDQVELADLESANGTFVNGERLSGSRRLKPGDVIGIADAEEFRLVEL